MCVAPASEALYPIYLLCESREPVNRLRCVSVDRSAWVRATSGVCETEALFSDPNHRSVALSLKTTPDIGFSSSFSSGSRSSGR